METFVIIYSPSLLLEHWKSLSDSGGQFINSFGGEKSGNKFWMSTWQAVQLSTSGHDWSVQAVCGGPLKGNIYHELCPVNLCSAFKCSATLLAQTLIRKQWEGSVSFKVFDFQGEKGSRAALQWNLDFTLIGVLCNFMVIWGLFLKTKVTKFLVDLENVDMEL